MKNKIFPIIALISFLIAAALTVSCWNMNFWPTDAEVYYMPAAKELPSMKYLSQMNKGVDEERIKWLHGKELHVLAISLFQRVMNDTETLRPLLLLGVFSIFCSSLLIFMIARRLWKEVIGAVAWFLFSSSFWPYLYILFVKHQTQGLMFALLSLTLILYARGWIFYVLSGLCMGVSVFSSTTSFLYIPFIAAALMSNKKEMIKSFILCGCGFLAVICYVNYPDIIGNLKSYMQYIQISGKYNHFFYNQRALVQWLPSFDLSKTRGGLLWVVKYFILVMPFIFPLYLASVWYLLKNKYHQKTVILILLSMAPVIMAEAKGVAQYGANYFPSLLGIIMLIGFAASFFVKDPLFKRYKNLICMLAAIQALYNGYVFVNDIYPSRMVTTLISQSLQEKGIKAVFTYRMHLLRPNILDHLNPKILQDLKVVPIDSVIQAPVGYILLPPVSTDSLYRASNGDYTDFDQDLMLNEIVRQGKLKDYAVDSFKTLGSSLIWSQEEEILAYRYLVLGQFKGGDKSKAWLLDAAKIQQDRQMFIPTPEDLFVYSNHISAIGTIVKQGMYDGYQGEVKVPTQLKGVVARMFKMGNPKDNLRAFVFKVDDKQPMWVPYQPNFISKPVSASMVTASPAGDAVIFNFDPPLELEVGAFSVLIYRDGKSSDTDFYRIYKDMLGKV